MLTLAVTFSTFMSVIALPAFLVLITRKRPLVPWVGDAVQSFDHNGPGDNGLDDSTTESQTPFFPRRAA